MSDKYKITITLDSKLAKKIYRTVSNIEDDVDSILARDPAAKNRSEVVLLYSGFHALLLYRLAHAMNQKGLEIPARAVSQFAKFLTGIEIHPGAKIGKGLFIDHGSGVVIGETAVIGDYCTIYQGVTLGGTGKEVGKRHPTLGNNVMIGAGAKLLGNFTVGDNSKIASGAVVLGNVPANCTAVGIPAHVVKRDGEKVKAEADLDQVNIPDPVENEIEALEKRVAQLEELIKKQTEKN
ncbi:MAG: serine O-acetyltransferase [Eubacteriales bacterium]